MKRILFILTFVSVLQISAVAQQYCSEQVQCESYPWYFGTEAGMQVFFGRNDSKMSFDDRITPSIDLFLGKQLNSVLSLDLVYSNAKMKGIASPLVKDAHFLTEKMYVGSNPEEALVLQKGYMMDLYLRLLVDLCNWWGVVDPSRRFCASAYVGGGLALGYGRNNDAISPSINAGFVYGYHFNPSLALNLTLKGALVSKSFDGEHCTEHTFHGIAGLNIGITYAFGKK